MSRILIFISYAVVLIFGVSIALVIIKLIPDILLGLAVSLIFAGLWGMLWGFYVPIIIRNFIKQ
jgi:hypothetical protein